MAEMFDDLPTSNILERLPPVEHAPILYELGRLGMRKFKATYAIETPTHPDTGIVDHKKLVENVSALVSTDYRWRAPFFDEHHLHWKGYYYNPGLHNGSLIPKRFRDLNTNKLWVPREFHDFVHAVTIPSDVPSHDAMEQAVEDFRSKEYMYTISSQVITLLERIERAVPLPKQNDDELLRLRDPITKRIVPDGLYEERRKLFMEEVEYYFHNDLPPDLTHLSVLWLEELSEFEEIIPLFRRELKESLALANNRRRGRAVRLLLERPQKQAA